MRASEEMRYVRADQRRSRRLVRVVNESLANVSPEGWEESNRIEVCSWVCLRLAFMADEPDNPEGESPESWIGN